ncbi:MAG: GNAT family N-acetyltransferase [Chloroflexota bacterium]
MKLRPLTRDDAALAVAFLDAMPDGDRTFFKEPVGLETVQRWCDEPTSSRWLLIDDEGAAVAYLAVVPGVGWSAHVGERRLIVAPSHRRRGLGTRLAREGLVAGVRAGLRKLTVEVVADKVGDIEMFSALGFDPEGLLVDHIRDRSGHLRDLVILSHQVDDVADDLARIGVDGELDVPASGPGPTR